MENSKIQQLATSGLVEFSLPAADTESRGTNTDIVSQACTILDEQSTAITSFITELETTKTQLLANWEGESADGFRQKFPELIDTFEKIPKCVESISDWASELSAAYIKIDQASF